MCEGERERKKRKGEKGEEGRGQGERKIDLNFESLRKAETILSYIR